MSGLGASVAVICIVVFQSGQITATFWQTAALPSDPDDPYYKSKLTASIINRESMRFQTVLPKQEKIIHCHPLFSLDYGQYCMAARCEIFP